MKVKFKNNTFELHIYYLIFYPSYIEFQLQDVVNYRNSEHFYDKTVCGKIITIGRTFTVAGSPCLKVNSYIYIHGFYLTLNMYNIIFILSNILFHFFFNLLNNN